MNELNVIKKKLDDLIKTKEINKDTIISLSRELDKIILKSQEKSDSCKKLKL